MRLIHTTLRANADRILASGFKGHSEERERGRLFKGSWLSDGPLECIGGVYLEVHAALAKEIGTKALRGLEPLVSPATLLRWHRELVARK
jgi:hypothetical protein